MAAASFADNLLAVDEPLWGGFWQGDVIAPGYRLPAVELALLRAIRLDERWPEGTTVPPYLADLRRTILDPQVGIWTLTVAGQPCVVLAAPGEYPKSQIKYTCTATARESGRKRPKSITVVWYCASTGRLHAGYRTIAAELNLGDAVKQRGLESISELKPTSKEKLDWLAQAVKQREVDDAHSLAARLDLEILQIRAK